MAEEFEQETGSIFSRHRDNKAQLPHVMRMVANPSSLRPFTWLCDGNQCFEGTTARSAAEQGCGLVVFASDVLRSVSRTDLPGIVSPQPDASDAVVGTIKQDAYGRDGKKFIENSFCDKKLSHLMTAILVFSAPLVPLEKRHDGKNNAGKKFGNNKLSYLMPALFCAISTNRRTR